MAYPQLCSTLLSQAIWSCASVSLMQGLMQTAIMAAIHAVLLLRQLYG